MYVMSEIRIPKYEKTNKGFPPPNRKIFAARFLADKNYMALRTSACATSWLQFPPGGPPSKASTRVSTRQTESLRHVVRRFKVYEACPTQKTED